MNTPQDPGRTRVIIAIVLLLAVEITPLLTQPGADLEQVAIRLGILAILQAFLWQGHGWARFLSILLCALAAILAGYLVFAERDLRMAPVMLGAGIAGYLLSTPEVKTFQERQRSRT